MGVSISITVFQKMLKEWLSEDPPEWVLKERAARAELERTGERVVVEPHEDNCGAPCRNVGPQTLLEDCRTHDCCYDCNRQGGDGA